MHHHLNIDCVFVFFFSSGYTSHSLDAANEAKVKLFKLFETVDVIRYVHFKSK